VRAKRSGTLLIAQGREAMSENYLKDPRANSVAGWIAALEIFERHKSDKRGWRPVNGAEHDIIYMTDTPTPLRTTRGYGETICEWSDETKADAEQLEALGFHWSSEDDCWAKFT
jgi:hypothetical protein